jgi:hypothetical protein
MLALVKAHPDITAMTFYVFGLLVLYHFLRRNAKSISKK